MENTTEFYTPELNEFHVGFEYEIFTTNGTGFGWVKEFFEIETFESMPSTPNGGEKPFIYFIGNINEIQVKKLSRECIESLGWEFVNSAFGDYCLNNKYFLTYRNESVEIGYDKGFQVWTNVCRGVPCKNKSELSKLMTMLNIKI